jgi:hypothetical protein
MQRRMHVLRAQVVQHVAERHLRLEDRRRLVEPDAARGEQAQHEPAGGDRGHPGDLARERDPQRDGDGRRGRGHRDRGEQCGGGDAAGAVAEQQDQPGVQRGDRRQHGDDRAGPVGGAGVRDEHARDPEQRHRQHIRHGERAHRLVTRAEHGADERAR